LSIKLTVYKALIDQIDSVSKKGAALLILLTMYSRKLG